MQKLDPPGVGARDLKECLLLQLTPGMDYYEELKTLISNHLEDLEHNRLPQIERKTGYSIELIKEALEHLRKLNPKPGAAFTSTYVQPVQPDVFIELVEGGRYKVRLEDGHTPNLFISPYYRKLLTSSDTDEKTREYIKRKINSAQWLIESIEQRRNTLTKVAQAIVDHQNEFLNKGPEFIEPLKMQQIADKVGVHVTTVSRAVDDKWIQTPRGIFPLKRFFVGGTVSAAGEEVAWDTVRMKLQEVIDKEDKANPLSDDDLVQELHKHGLTVARRTVTKYRKAMNIPSSRQRRDWSRRSKNCGSNRGRAVKRRPAHPIPGRRKQPKRRPAAGCAFYIVRLCESAARPESAKGVAFRVSRPSSFVFRLFAHVVSKCSPRRCRSAHRVLSIKSATSVACSIPRSRNSGSVRSLERTMIVPTFISRSSRLWCTVTSSMSIVSSRFVVRAKMPCS